MKTLTLSYIKQGNAYQGAVKYPSGVVEPVREPTGAVTLYDQPDAAVRRAAQEIWNRGDLSSTYLLIIFVCILIAGALGFSVYSRDGALAAITVSVFVGGVFLFNKLIANTLDWRKMRPAIIDLVKRK